MAMNNRNPKRRHFTRRKACRFCTENVKIDYKDQRLMLSFITERGKILPARITGTCARHQRELAMAIKRSRFIALVPFGPPDVEDSRREG